MFSWISNQEPGQLTAGTIALRLVLACLLSGALGIERTYKRRAAGVRTYMLVSVGASLVMMTGIYLFNYGGTADATRLGAQVISGIGFLGAGTIMMTGHYKIRGLTTAAGLWAAACMGLAIGAGFYVGAAVMCGLVLIVLIVFGWVQARCLSKVHRLRLYVVFDNLQHLMAFLDFIKEKKGAISEFETHEPDNQAGVGAFLSVRFSERRSHAELIELVRDCEGLTFIEGL